jgi:UDP-N-acetylmuramyl pentapeptide synthase
VFIAEMGARKIGDISRLMKLVSPQIGVLTGVTNQHLETFKSLENVYAEKEKVITLLSTDGYGVVNASSLDITKLSALRADFVGVEGTSVYAEDVDVGSNGVTFKLVLGEKKYVCRTKLLGVHNMQNLITAATVALYLKIPPEEIVRAIGTMPQIPHRLQLIKNGGVTIIDDTYNGNPVGAAEAINALKCFSGRKIAVTPGLVELGADEDEENKRLGERLAEVFDKVVLIGKSRAEKIKAGLIRGGLSESDIAEYPSLQRAEASFPTLFKQGDTVLFLNDLPDVYDE